jgi:hypothetical protein
MLQASGLLGRRAYLPLSELTGLGIGMGRYVGGGRPRFTVPDMLANGEKAAKADISLLRNY